LLSVNDYLGSAKQGYKILLTGLIIIILMYPVSASAWFNKDGDGIAFQDNLKHKAMTYSNSYVILSNETPGIQQYHFILPDVKPRSYLVVDSIDMDIPLNLLSGNMIDPKEYIDRLLAVNMRITAILDEYSKLDKRAEAILKDLTIPYINNKNNKKRNLFLTSTEKPSVSSRKKNLKKHLAKVINNNRSHKSFSNGYIHGKFNIIKQNSSKNRSTSNGSDKDYQDQNSKPDRISGPPDMIISSRTDDELPRVFILLLDGLKYCFENKIKIIFYIVFLVFIIALIPFKGQK